MLVVGTDRVCRSPVPLGHIQASISLRQLVASACLVSG